MDSNNDSLILNIFRSEDSAVKKKNKKKNVDKIAAKKESFGNNDRKADQHLDRDLDRPRRTFQKNDGPRWRDRDDNRPKKDKFSYAKLNSRLFDETSDQRPTFTLTETQSRVEPVFSSHNYSELSLHPYLVKCLSDRLSINETTSVQQNAIPVLLSGSDALVKSMTGSGKTLAFAVPIVQTLQSLEPPLMRSDGIHALVIVPTRELVLQCYECFTVLCQSFKRLVTGYLCGGEKKKSEKARIRKGINILITTPGRLLDHMQSTGNLHLRRVKWFVIDEADRLLEQGFEESIQKVVQHLSEVAYDRPQTVLLSATLTSAVQRLAGMSLNNPKVVDVSDQNLDEIVLPENLKQQFIVCAPKLRLITLSTLLMDKCSLNDSKALVFCVSQDVVDFHCMLFTTVFNGLLTKSNHKTIDFYQLHGNMDQSKRRQVFNEFRDATNAVLFCTDVASRGLDLPKVDWIIQFSCAPKSEDFVHRVGRTARIGNAGNAVQFILPTETKFLEQLQKNLKLNFIELQIKDMIKTLMRLESLRGRNIFTAEEYATQLQTAFETALSKDEDLMSLAKKAYLSFIRSYAAYPKAITEVLPFRSLHLGHLAKSFALQDSPKALGAFGFRLKQQSIDLQYKYDKYNRRIDYQSNKRKNEDQRNDNNDDNDNDITSGYSSGADDNHNEHPIAKRVKHSNTMVPMEMRYSKFGGPLITKSNDKLTKRHENRN